MMLSYFLIPDTITHEESDRNEYMLDKHYSYGLHTLPELKTTLVERLIFDVYFVFRVSLSRDEESKNPPFNETFYAFGSRFLAFIVVIIPLLRVHLSGLQDYRWTIRRSY